MVKVVNGYLCFSSCEEASARQGKDPHAPPGAAQSDKSKDKHKAGVFDSQPATVRDGALKNALGNDAVQPANASAASGDTRSATVNILA